VHSASPLSMAMALKIPVVPGVPAPPPSPTTARRQEAARVQARYLHADVQRILDKYGGNGTTYRGVPSTLADSPAATAKSQEFTGSSSWPRMTPPSTARGASTSTLLCSRLAGDVSSDSVATPFGLGSLVGARPGGRARTVQFSWGRAFLLPSCVNESRAVVLECQLRTLNAIFGVLVHGLPQISKQRSNAGACLLDTSSLSSDDSDGGLPAEAESVVQGLSLVRTLTAWLDEAALHPVPVHRDELMDVAVLLSGLVRTRTELVRLKGQANDMQLEAERQAAGAVRIHLGFLERLLTQHSTPPRPVGLAETCRQWQDVFEQLKAANPTSGDASAEGAGGPGDGKSGQHRLTAWRLVRPGAKLVDQRAEEVLAAPSPLAPQLRVLTAADASTPLLSIPVRASTPLPRAHQHTVVHHRSPSPPMRFSSGPAIACLWPAPAALPAAALAGSAAIGSLRHLHICGSVAALAAPAQAVGQQPLAGATIHTPARVVSTAATVRLGASPSASSDAVGVQFAGVVRSPTPLIRQASTAATRWLSPTILRKATTPVPAGQQCRGRIGRDRPAETPSEALAEVPSSCRATPSSSPTMLSRGCKDFDSDSDDSLPLVPRIAPSPLLASGGLPVAGEMPRQQSTH